VCVACGEQRNCTTEADVSNSCALSSVKHQSSPANALRPTTAAAAAGSHGNSSTPASRPARPVRQSTGGRLLVGRHGTTAPRPGDDAEAAASTRPARRASAPSSTGSTPPAPVSIRRHRRQILSPIGN